MDDGIMEEEFSISGMTCSACSAHVERAIRKEPGVRQVQVNLMAEMAKVEYDPAQTSPEALIQAVVQAGYGAAPRKKGGPSGSGRREVSHQKEQRAMKTRLVASLLLLLPLMYLSMGHMVALPLPPVLEGAANGVSFGLTQLLLTLPILVINRSYFVQGMRMLWHRSPNMDTLIGVGAGAAMVYSLFALYQMSYGLGHGDMSRVMKYHMELYFESAAMIVTLITLGKYLETRSKGQTSQALNRLIQLAPSMAKVIRQGEEQVVPVEELRLGDHIVVAPGQGIPADGTVVEGLSSVDQSPLTGEFLPVDKGPGDSVAAASINLTGSLEIQVDRIGEDTTLGQMIRLVEAAAASKAPIAQLADRVAGIFVPVVMVLAGLTALIWWLQTGDGTMALTTGVAVLVISCPCALGLATPVAILVATGKGAEHGILVKSAEAFEELNHISVVVMDKTGTLTTGKPQVTDLLARSAGEEKGLIQVAMALEKPSEHPLAKAIVQWAKDQGGDPGPVEAFQAVHGRGVQGCVEDVLCYGGSLAWMRELGVELGDLPQKGEILAQEGKTPMYFARGKESLGLIAVADVPKETSQQAVAQLGHMGLQVIMLTGDYHSTAQAMGERLGVTQILAEMLPQEKEAAIQKLQSQGHKVLMVGDGINDAPALVRADVGMAIGAGTDIALESADVVLMKSELGDVVVALNLARRTLQIVKENLFWAFFYNALGIPLAAGVFYALGWTQGMLNPMFAAAAMSLSSVCVVSNALRLRFFTPKTAPNHPMDQTVRETQGKGENVMKKTIQIQGMMCGHCTSHVEKALAAVPGVMEVEVRLEEGCAHVTLQEEVSPEALREAVTQAGYEVVSMV